MRSSMKVRWFVMLVAVVGLAVQASPVAAAPGSGEPVVAEFFIPFGNIGDTNPCNGEFVQTSGTARIEVLEATHDGRSGTVELRYSDALSNADYTRTSLGKATFSSISNTYTFQTLSHYRGINDPALDFDVEADAIVFMSDGIPVGFWLSATRIACTAGGPAANR